jgi:SAM-dependent methyltransferase
VNRDCPICDASGRKLLFRQQFSEMSEGSLLVGYDVVVCDRCGFAYADDIPDQRAFDEHYEKMSKYEYADRGGAESSYDLLRFRQIAEIIAGLPIPRTAQIVEVGCATGGQLQCLKEKGFERVFGVDPSPACAEAARRLYGIEVAVGACSRLPRIDGPCDVLIFSSVLEHIRDVKPALAKLSAMLSAGGLMFVEVPDAARFADWDDAPFQQFSTEHINFFSPVSLGNAMATARFSPVLCQRNHYEQQHGTTMPVADAVFRKDGRPAPLARDEETEPTLLEYIRKSRQVEGHLHAVIDALVAEGRPIVVWGIGTHTLRLLATSRLGEARITAYVDSNPHYQGKRLGGVPVIAPAELRSRDEPIVISSRVFQRDIERQIRDTLALKNRVHLLYAL